MWVRHHIVLTSYAVLYRSFHFIMVLMIIVILHQSDHTVQSRTHVSNIKQRKTIKKNRCITLSCLIKDATTHHYLQSKCEFVIKIVL